MPTNNPILMRKVLSALPPTLEPNTLYCVRVGTGFDLYLSNALGTAAFKTNGVATLLPEYTDTDPASPQVGEQWVRITTVAPVGTLYSTAMLGMLRRTVAYRTAAVKTKTSIGII